MASTSAAAWASLQSAAVGVCSFAASGSVDRSHGAGVAVGRGEQNTPLPSEALLALTFVAEAELPREAQEAGIVNGWTLAHEAAANGSVGQLRLLDLFPETRAMLYHAATCKEEEVATGGLRQPRACAQRFTPARAAAAGGHVDAVRYLGEHPDAKVRDTVMDCRCFRSLALDAATAGHVAVLHYLAERGRELRRHPFWCSGYGARGQSLPMVSILRGFSLEVVRALMETGTVEQQGMLICALFRLRSEKDRHSFYGAALFRNAIGENGTLIVLVLELLDRLAPTLGMLNDRDGQPDHWDLRGGSDWVLVRAVREGHASIIQAFLLALRPRLARNVFHSLLTDCDLNLSGNIVHLAAARGRREIIHALAEHDNVIDAKALFQARTDDGDLPAELARRNGHEALALFLETAADLNSGPRVALEKYDAGWRNRMLSVVRQASFQNALIRADGRSLCGASAGHACVPVC